MNQRLGVALGPEAVAALFEVGAQLEVVEDLAVAHDPDARILVAHRLLASAEVDDAEASVPEADSRALVVALGIGSAVRERARHAPQRRAVRRPRLGVPDAG